MVMHSNDLSSKSALRAQFLRLRQSLPQAEAEAHAATIAASLRRWVKELKPRIVAGYMAMRGEVDLLPFFKSLATSKTRIALPVTQAESRRMLFRLWQPGDGLMPSGLGMREPLPEAPECAPDLVLVPLLAFDRTGHRLGYGKGYYDATLAHLRAQAIGIAYALQEAPSLPAESHDMRLDSIITEKEMITCPH